jgi:hypothetical protein
MTEKEKTMTRDEALTKACDDGNDAFHKMRGNGFEHETAAKEGRAAFLASLKASGWTLARVEPTDRMIQAGKIAELDWLMTRSELRTITKEAFMFQAMLAAQEEDDEG